MKRTTFLLCLALACLSVAAKVRVVAHRGYWKTEHNAQNSITALREAIRIGCEGAELDVWLTADSVPVVFHDATLDGLRIEDTPYPQLMLHRLGNQEFLPTLQQYLQEGARQTATRFVLEVKPHSRPERDERAVRLVVRLIRMMGLEAQTDYISFSRRACQTLHELEPEALVSYLTGDLSPRQVKEQGWSGIDYHMGVFDKNPTWIAEAKELGLDVNVWTVDGEAALRRFASMPGVDAITTNDPNLLVEILQEP